jgi:very-short-patch-repair endonuclease
MSKSPIEGQLRNAICARAEVEKVDLYDFCDTPQERLEPRNGKISFTEWSAAPDGDPDHYHHRNPDSDEFRSWSLFAGVRVASYVVDFLLVNCDGGVAIECDGHEFHDRTKQQAASDRSRDRELLAIGLATVRFTGSEIHHDSDRCAAEAFRCAKSEADRNGALMVGYDLGEAAGREAGVRTGVRECHAILRQHGALAPLALEEHW